MIILIQCVARVMKQRIKKDMRQVNSRYSISDIPFREAIITQLNNLFGKDEQNYWQNLKQEIQKKFIGALSDEVFLFLIFIDLLIIGYSVFICIFFCYYSMNLMENRKWILISI